VKKYIFYVGTKIISDSFETIEVNNKVIQYSKDNVKIIKSESKIALFYGPYYDSDEFIIESLNSLNSKDFLNRLDADCSVVIYELKNDKLYASRDRFGIKSTYYASGNDFIIVSNSSKEILEYGLIEKKPNIKKGLVYVASHYRYIDMPTEESFFENISLVKQANFITCDNQYSIKQEEYWRLELLDLSNKSFEEVGEEYVDTLKSSVAKRLKKSKKPAFMVSSGMDSSSVAALSKSILNENVEFLTTVYEGETEYNEADEIIDLAEKISSKWEKILITDKTILEDINYITQNTDQPFATVTQMMHTYLVRSSVEKGYDYIFGGLGGDEANSGEIEEYMFFFADLRKRGEEELLNKEVEGWKKYHEHPLYPKNHKVLNDYFDKYIDFNSPGMNYLDIDRFNIYKDSVNIEYQVNIVPPKLDYPYRSYLRNKLHQDLFYEGIPIVLKAEEFNLNAFGLDGMYPYLDKDVMQYGFSIPLNYKYKDGRNKALLRDSIGEYLPKSVTRNCTKKGWNAPFNEWLKTIVKDELFSILNNPTKRQKELYDLNYIQDILEEHLESKNNHMMFFWQFINYEKWYAANF